MMDAPADDPKIQDRICELLGEGVPLRQILRDEPGMPAVTTFYARLDEKGSQFDAALTERIAGARARGYDAIAADTLEIADDGRNDWMKKFDRDGGNAGWQVNNEHVQRSKLRIETRLKLLAKWDPKRYGEKITQEHTGADGKPIEIISEVRRTVVDPKA